MNIMDKEDRFRFVATSGVGGDCTSNYRVKFFGHMTLAQMLDEIISERSNEWGDVKYVDDKDVDHFLFEYRHGDIIKKSEEYEKYKDQLIKDITANGGWSCMCYRVFFNYREV